ncbi:glucans biosynthesis glucosyltransferase MdoH [Amaricoccus macauensis]|uniref:glucans biosynthesis glucosyltransferase MdoH n=1 Tax=Amaricoccus macauensis TaxID=57001 RepID=UPI003C79858D
MNTISIKANPQNAPAGAAGRDTPLMPPEAPLQRPIQNLYAPYRDTAAPGVQSGPNVGLWRLATFLPAIVMTAGLIAAFTEWFSPDGHTSFEILLIILIATTFFWIALSVSTVTVGIINRLRERNSAEADTPPEPLKVALLVPIYNEVPWDVYGNAAAMLEELLERDCVHDYTLFILSDTRDEAIAKQELQALEELRRSFPVAEKICYRRRVENTDRKVGNLADWVERWGGAYEAMLVLDADSLMAGSAISELADELSRDPTAGLIQSFPQLFGAQSLFGRVQQFSSAIYGSLLSEGLAKWTDREGNYWGHNAIIRTAAFASCAGLPRIWTPQEKDALILSHDFVEAGLLRRAGWSVRFLPRIRGSYEEVPATLVDYVIRDRRWCQGNLQHLNILNSRGFHAVSRFHLFQGAMAYLLSPAWFMLLVSWAIIGNGGENNVISYFSAANPMFPEWPEMSSVNNFFILLFMYGMLLAPKFMGASSVWMTGITLQKLGGLKQFVMSFLIEIVLSIAFAPVLMVQQTVAVVRTLFGIKETWNPQQRAGGKYSIKELAKFHWLETSIGVLLLSGMYLGIVSIWLLPIALSLAIAILLSALSGVNLREMKWSRNHMGTPEEFDEPNIIRLARDYRLRLRGILEAGPADKIAAE